MLTDRELREMRAKKKRDDLLKTPAGQAAAKAAKTNWRTEEEVRASLAPYIDGMKPPEIPKVKKSDPVRESLIAAGYIKEDYENE